MRGNSSDRHEGGEQALTVPVKVASGSSSKDDNTITQLFSEGDTLETVGVASSRGHPLSTVIAHGAVRGRWTR